MACQIAYDGGVGLATVPLPPAVFLGRKGELDKLSSALEGVSVAVIVGIAGAGKSALAFSFARSKEDSGRPVLFLRARSAGLSTLVDDARRALEGGAVFEVASDEERIDDLVTRMNQKRALLLIDDLHALGPAASLALVVGVAGLLRGGQCIVTTRARLGRQAHHPDWVELQLGGLDEAAARALWASLDELYGPAGEFDTLPGSMRSSPFLLRRAHSGALEDDDPIELTLQALGSDERRAALVLSLARHRLTVACLQQTLGAVTKRALASLVRQLVVELDAGGTAAVSGPFLDAVASGATPEELRSAHGLLAQIAATFRDPVVAFRDEVFHLSEAGELSAASARIEVMAAKMVRLGAAGEVLRAIEGIPTSARSVGARIAHARALARLVEPRRAQEELALLDAEPCAGTSNPSWRDEVRFSLATTTYMVGRISVGLGLLDKLLTSPGLASDLAFQIELQRSWALTTSGRGVEARAWLRALESRSERDEERALLAFYRAVSAWSDEDEAAMNDALPRSLTLVADQAPPYATGGLIPLSLSVMMARLGRFTEADRFLSMAEIGWARADDLSSHLLLRRMRGLCALERGQRCEALELLWPVADAYERAGSLVAELGLRAVIGRLLLVLGRRREANAMLDAAAEQAERCGAGQAGQAVLRARDADPLLALSLAPAQPEPERPRRGEYVRRRALLALSAAEAGQVERVRALLNGLDASGAGYGLDRAVVEVARAALRRLEGDLADAAVLLERAANEARADGADEEIVRELGRRLAVPMLVTGGSRQPSRAPLGPERLDVVLDGRTHRLTTPRANLDLGNRPTLRKLLYALARNPGAILTKQQLAKAIWPARYNPLTHDNALWVNVRRLRVLLAETRLTIASDDRGYRLEAPPDFVFVDPA